MSAAASVQPGRAHTIALLVIDVQRGFDEIAATGLPRNNPDAEAAIGRLLAAFRRAGAPVIHIRHASDEPGSVFRHDRPGYAVQEIAREAPGEPVLVKRVNSAFIGTELEARLRGAGTGTIVVVGATTNHCVETTTRMGGNLGFDMRPVRDATWTFDRVGPDGELHRAADIHRMSLANLSGEFATIATADEILREIDPAQALSLTS